MQKSSSGFDFKPGAILTVPSGNNQSRFGKDKGPIKEELKEPSDLLVGDGDFTLTPQIKEHFEQFNKSLVSSEKYERRIVVEGMQLSQPQTIQIEDE